VSFKPIPKKALIHKITYTEFEENTGGWGGGSNNEPREIKHVRFQPKSEVKKTSETEEKLVKGVLFIDQKHSKPFIPLVPQSDVVFQGESLTVLTCEPVYTISEIPHHYEVELI